MLTLVRLWILLSCLLVGAGWALSALHQLNRAGYGIVFATAGILLAVWRRKFLRRPPLQPARLFHSFRRRFRRPAAGCFLLLAILALVAGGLYTPLNYDANAYRLPRILHWLAAGQWHWIHTCDLRMNIAACGMEWLSAPLILFTHTDRFLFLINWVSFLMLPGLLFSVFTRLQVRPRVAWWWMWILASGWCFALQASSIANDSFAAVYILAAVDLALRAREKKSVSDLWLSLLAAALCTGTKQTNLPLALLWLIAAWPSFPLFRTRPLRSVLVLLAGLLASLAPISLLNHAHTGTWLPLDINGIGQLRLDPFWGILGNAFYIPAQNLLPPLYDLIPPFYTYWAISWNEMMRQFLATSWGAPFASFQNFGFMSSVYYPGTSEGNVGLGAGICLLIFISFLALHQRRQSTGFKHPRPPSDPYLRGLRLAPWGLLFIFMAKVGSIEIARLLTPYYAFLLPAWLVRTEHRALMCQRAWQRCGLLVMAFTVVLMATLGDRPLFPAKTLLPQLREQFPDSKLISALCSHYLESPYQMMEARSRYLQQRLPPDETVIGYFTSVCEVDEAGVLLPYYGQRRIEYLLPEDPPERLRSLNIRYVVVSETAVLRTVGSLEHWLAKYHGTLMGQHAFPRPSNRTFTPYTLYLVRLN